MAWGHTGSSTRVRKARQTLSARKLMVTVFWDAQGAYRIHDTWNNNQFRSLLSHIEETEKSHPEQTSRPTEFWGCASAR
ncbi:hypothetical protein AVEN_165951-1 [Araneus ventricosus]|uniref:Uncharacterized protein n=1 Tax=Araneus ventricosus TaxID=182803 RepID=A0A4Y2V870_ARAVE|nr:hypothetical protein AVEN_237250-1 [Araneus ventricosus]GBO20778.1 hypothetical protein AVEN_165951-1 [Araneus ventricosus]